MSEELIREMERITGYDTEGNKIPQLTVGQARIEEIRREFQNWPDEGASLMAQELLEEIDDLRRQLFQLKRMDQE